MAAKFVRVRDKHTGHKFSTANPNLPHLEVLDEPATSRNGRVLDPEPRRVSAKETKPAPGPIVLNTDDKKEARK